MRSIARFVGALVLAIATIGAVFFFGMRTKFRPVQTAVRRFNKKVTNPRVLKSAGSPGASAAIIRHVGRSTGRTYETPVGPFPVENGFVIALPYGPTTDWARNVLSSGSATLVHDGDTIEVDRPEVLGTGAFLPDLPASDQRTLRLFAVDQCLRVRRAEQPPFDV